MNQIKRYLTVSGGAMLMLALIASVTVSAATAQTPGKAMTLKASDGQTVFGVFAKANNKHDKILLLFHQAGANRHEYDPLIPKFNAAGYDVLAIDQRSGGKRWGHGNETVQKYGDSASYLDAYADLKGALMWAVSRDYNTIVTVGSSYSSSLNILLARDYPNKIDAAASFSPGEYLGKANMVKNAAAKVTIPLYITAEPKGGEQRADEVLRKTKGDNITRYKPKIGVHGASTLVKSRDPKGYKTNLKHFMDWLRMLSS